VLPNDDRVLVQIRDIRSATVLGILLQDHPHKVRVPHPLHNAVWVLDCIGPSVVCPVLSAPPSNGALDCTTADACEEDSEWKAADELNIG
jgi:hypothetical protein